jgi:hypothetical protein
MGLLDGKDLTFVNNRFTDGDNVVGPTHRPLSTPQKYSYVSGTNLC